MIWSSWISTNSSVLLWQAEGAAISGGRITAVKEEAMDGEEAEGSTSEKKGKKKVKKEKGDDEYQNFQARIDWFRYGPRQIGSEGTTRFVTVTVKASLISSLLFFHVSDWWQDAPSYEGAHNIASQISPSGLVWFGTTR